MAIGDTWTKVITLADGVEVTVTATETASGVEFIMDVTKGFADLRGFFFNENSDAQLGYDAANTTWGDSVVTESGKFATTSSAVLNQTDSYVGSKDNNMNGSGEKFDGGITFGSEGIGKDDISYTKFTITGLKLEDLTGESFGIRATSVGATADSREGSVKTVAEFPPPEGKEPVADDFPLWEQDVSNIILVFDQTDGDTKPKVKDGDDGDGYYTVKIDNWPAPADDDLDNSIDAILAYLVEKDPYIGEDSELLGVIIKGGTQDTNFYAYGENNTNGTAPDEAPEGLALSWSGSSNPSPANNVDTSYNYVDVLS